MRGIVMAGLLVGVVVLAGCSERSVATGPSAPLTSAAALSAAGFIGDRPYTWSLKCSGDLNSSAHWSWTTAATSITGTSVSAGCLSGQTSSGSGVRPASADGFSACVNGTCETWTFDPAGPFKAQLKGTYKWCEPNWTNHGKPCVWVSSTATLNVDS